MLGEVDGLGTFKLELDDWPALDLEAWDWPDLGAIDWPSLDDDIGATLARVQETDAAQLDALAKPDKCPYCGQPMPSKSEA